MKHLLLLSTFLNFSASFSQNQFYFKISTGSSVHITDSECIKIAESSKRQLNQEIKYIKLTQETEGIKIKDLSIEEQTYLKVLEELNENPTRLFPSFAIPNSIFKMYRSSVEGPLFFSLNKESFKTIGKPNLEISLNNIEVGSTETSLDIGLINLDDPNAPKKSQHFSCATGRILSIMIDSEINVEMPWFEFWRVFYREVKLQDWLEQSISLVYPSLISQQEKERRLDIAIADAGLYNKESQQLRKDQAKTILKDIPYDIPFDQTVATLISKDEDKISLLSFSKIIGSMSYQDDALELEEVDPFALNSYEIMKWYFVKSNGAWNMYFSEIIESDSLSTIRSFYANALGADQKFNEEMWLTNLEMEKESGWENYLKFTKESASSETEKLVREEIQPKLTKLISDSNCEYYQMYQRLNSYYETYWYSELKHDFVLKDILISNPEKTAFIFPALLMKKVAMSTDYYQSMEIFKFYVLLKNSNGTYTLYDWHFFEPFEYQTNFSLLRCAKRHLEHISNYSEESETINDSLFWSNYVYKSSPRGFDYLTPVVLPNESISVSKSEFDGKVQDCIDLLLGHDLVDLDKYQLKQMIRCLNTIQKNNLSSPLYSKLNTLSKELNFQKRLDRIEEPKENYYPSLEIEFGATLKEHSYYQIR